MRPICESQRLETLADVYGPPRGGGPFGGQLCPGAQFAVEAQRLRERMPSVAPGWLSEQAALAVPSSMACASGSPFQAA